MARTPVVARTLPALHRALDKLRARNARVALVPTMGALHEGHLTLVRQAKRRCEKVVVSIFVNPTQFAPHEDFSTYPRTWKTDLAKLADEKVDLIWNPDVKTMYPDGFATRISCEGPDIADLEDSLCFSRSVLHGFIERQGFLRHLSRTFAFYPPEGEAGSCHQ